MFNNAVESELIALESVRNEIFHFNILSNIQNTHRELCSAEQTICSWSYRSRPIKFSEENCFNDSALFLLHSSFSHRCSEIVCRSQLTLSKIAISNICRPQQQSSLSVRFSQHFWCVHELMFYDTRAALLFHSADLQHDGSGSDFSLPPSSIVDSEHKQRLS